MPQLSRPAPHRAFLSRQVLGWLAVGVAAVLGELALLAVLHEVLGAALWAASALAAETAMLIRFAATDRWVFGHARPTFGRALRYHGACAGAFAISWLVLNGLSALVALPYPLAWALGTAAGLTWSAASSFLWVWRPAAAARATAPLLGRSRAPLPRVR